jgi:hypothetical protein
MAFARIAENRIREAMQAGELDTLPGVEEPAGSRSFGACRHVIAPGSSLIRVMGRRAINGRAERG